MPLLSLFIALLALTASAVCAAAQPRDVTVGQILRGGCVNEHVRTRGTVVETFPDAVNTAFAHLFLSDGSEMTEEMQAALHAGAVGILLKSTANSKLIATIRKVAAGKTVIADDVEQLLADGQSTPELSPRQREILESITRGLSNAQIALQLDIGPESVKTHMAKLFAKLGAANRSEAVAIALRKHLLKM